MKKWKKTKRQKRDNRERKLINIKIDLTKEYVLALRRESQRTSKSISKIIDAYLRIATEKDLKEIREP